MSNMALNMLLGRLPSYTRKSRHLQMLRRYAAPGKLANIARAEWSRARGDLVSAGRPYIFTVDTGNLCNLRCPLCPTGYHELERPQSLMTLSEFEVILDKIKDYALEVILHNWGEPFLNPDILPIVRAARAAGLGTTISSNLNLVHRGDEFLEEVVDSGLDHLTVSLDGTTQDVNEQYRKGGDLEHVLHNLRTLLRYRQEKGKSTPVVEWQFLVMQHNEHQMDDARKMAAEIGVNRIRFAGAGLPFNDLANVELGKQWISETPEYSGYAPQTMVDRGYLYDEKCFYLYRAMTVNPKGGVAPCCALYHSDLDFGNLLTSDLDEIWNGAHYRSSRSLFSKKQEKDEIETACHRCPLFKYETRTNGSAGSAGSVGSVGSAHNGNCASSNGTSGAGSIHHLEGAVAADSGSLNGVEVQPALAAEMPSREIAGTRAEEIARRILDVTLASIACIVLAPVMIVLAILVKLDSPGPALFRQTRTGLRKGDGTPGSRSGQPFKLYKFRSMYADARERFPELYRYDYDPGELDEFPIKILVGKKDLSKDDLTSKRAVGGYDGDDPRVTRIGAWLRKTSLDELPNLFNVIKGDMHLVGPRPDIAENVRYYSERHLRKLDVKPGITGLAQISGRGFLTFNETNEFDVEYVDNRSLLLDIKILVKTIPAILTTDGAY